MDPHLSSYEIAIKTIKAIIRTLRESIGDKYTYVYVFNRYDIMAHTLVHIGKRSAIGWKPEDITCFANHISSSWDAEGFISKCSLVIGSIGPEKQKILDLLTSLFPEVTNGDG